jgi:rhodanese-related sulfurtransferase
MNEYIQFYHQHVLLATALIAVIVLFIINEVTGRLRATARCNPQQLVNMMNHQDALVIDIREKAAFVEGHIINARNIQPTDIPQRLSDADKAKPIVLVCGNGQQSDKLATSLKQQGFSQLYILAGGMASWRNDNMPITKK